MPALRETLEIIYFVSGPALVLVACLALSQIRVAKQQLTAQQEAIRISAKRDSLKATSEQIARYGSEIIPLHNALYNKIKSENINYLKKSKLTITNNELSVTPCTDIEEKKKLLLITQEFLSAMNAMEGFSVYFMSGVADEEIAFHSLSSTFCSSVSNLLPFIILMSDERNSYSSTTKLFMIWNSRLEKESLEKQKSDLEEKLKNQKNLTIRPFGCEA